MLTYADVCPASGATRFKRGNGSSSFLEPVAVAEARCRSALERALKQGYAGVKAEHIREYSEKFARTSLRAEAVC